MSKMTAASINCSQILLFFVQRENIELYLKGCESYGLKTIDLFQVNDLYEAKNLYTVVDNIFALGGMVSFSKKYIRAGFLIIYLSTAKL